MRNNNWKTIQIIQLVIFLAVSIFIFVRGVDGSGAVQTPTIKLICFAIWAIFYLIVLIVEGFIYFFTRRK